MFYVQFEIRLFFDITLVIKVNSNILCAANSDRVLDRYKIYNYLITTHYSFYVKSELSYGIFLIEMQK